MLKKLTFLHGTYTKSEGQEIEEKKKSEKWKVLGKRVDKSL